MKIFITILSFFIHSTISSPNDCRDVLYKKTHPIDCCVYPTIFHDDEIIAKCVSKCKEKGDTSSLCGRVCQLTEDEIYVDGKLKIENLKNLFMNGKNESADENVKQEKGVIADQWKDIYEESLKTCVKEREIDLNEAIIESKISEVVLKLIICVQRHNFVSCPNYVDTKQCNELKELIGTCSKATENFLFTVFLEHRKKDSGVIGVNKGGRFIHEL